MTRKKVHSNLASVIKTMGQCALRKQAEFTNDQYRFQSIGESIDTQHLNDTVVCQEDGQQLANIHELDYEQMTKLVIDGYLKSIINDGNDYKDIHSIILQYYHQGYAKFFNARNHTNQAKEECQNKMKFGDILIQYRDPNRWSNCADFYAMDIDGKLCSFDYSDTISCCISKYLDDPIAFYKYGTEGRISIYIGYDHPWIIRCFGDTLNKEYAAIKILLDEDYNFQSVEIRYACHYYQYFYPQKRKVTSKDIDEYWQIRKDERNLIKIKVEIIDHGLDECEIYSNLWKISSDIQNKTLKDPERKYIMYVGPKYERHQMIQKLNKFYWSLDEPPEITIGEIYSHDFFSWWYTSDYD